MRTHLATFQFIVFPENMEFIGRKPTFLAAEKKYIRQMADMLSLHGLLRGRWNNAYIERVLNVGRPHRKQPHLLESISSARSKTNMRSMHPFAALFLTVVFISPTFPSSVEFRSSERTVQGSQISTAQNLVATNVSITGKVKTPEGRPIKGAYIVIRDANTNEVVRAAYSSSFGYYRLEQIATGHTYVLSITHRRFLFALPAQLLEINEDRSGVDFTGEPSDE